MAQAKLAMAEDELKERHVFGIKSVPGIFSKLYREKERFEKAAKGEDLREQIDAAINFAITAWHITDWIWKSHKAALTEHYGECKRGFQRKIKEECPDLAVCDVIANAAKHGGAADLRKDRPNLETILVAHPVELVAELDKRGWSLRIEVDGKSDDPHAVFYRAFQFWHRFIQKYYFGK